MATLTSDTLTLTSDTLTLAAADEAAVAELMALVVVSTIGDDVLTEDPS